MWELDMFFSYSEILLHLTRLRFPWVTQRSLFHKRSCIALLRWLYTLLLIDTYSTSSSRTMVISSCQQFSKKKQFEQKFTSKLFFVLKRKYRETLNKI